jgi:hypothetical protein
MKLMLSTFTVFCGSCTIGLAQAEDIDKLIPKDLQGDKKLEKIARSLRSGYGDSFKGVFRNASDEVVVRLNDHDFTYDDKQAKSHQEMLDKPDIEDTFSITYPLGKPFLKPTKNSDPGRFRVEEMFKALYGTTKEQVLENCVTVEFCGRSVLFSKKHGASHALSAVNKDLEKLFADQPALRVYVSELGGTFNWRPIAGTTRLSNHSFANSIDLNPSKAAYWSWSPPSSLETFSRNGFPAEIVEAFERNGFIWGGKWWHYDTMHFEYRPELIAFAKHE